MALMDQAAAPQKTILMVEDDELLSGLLGNKLSKKFRLISVPTGEAAMQQLMKQVPDLILLDILLPGMDGFEVLRQVKADPKTAAVPVVILSNLGQPNDIEKGRRLGAEEFVVKVTLLPDEVVDLVEKVSQRAHKSAV